MSTLLRTVRLEREFPSGGWLGTHWGQGAARAVDDISLEINEGEILGLVGESGSGKTTLGRLVTGLDDPTKGSISFRGRELRDLLRSNEKAFRRRVQMIFQDPYESLNPRQRVLAAVAEPLKIHGIGRSGADRYKLVCDALKGVEVSNPETLLDKYPHQLSGGLRQRVAIARAVILNPEFIVADEPVSMLDVSIRAGVLNVMLKIKRERGVSFLFITHDLAVARYLSDRIAVIYRGKIVEEGSAAAVIERPEHPYTRALLAAVPVLHRMRQSTVTDGRQLGSPDSVPQQGCRYQARCTLAEDVCLHVEPGLVDIGQRFVACHVVARHHAAAGRASAS
jgi:peptide/nickel transport system ATP-binding protein